jgi:hypothetical protein
MKPLHLLIIFLSVLFPTRQSLQPPLPPGRKTNYQKAWKNDSPYFHNFLLPGKIFLCFLHYLVCAESSMVVSVYCKRKMQALDQLRSQQYAGAYARKRCEAADGNAGLFMGVAYAEGFITYKMELHTCLPVSDFLLERASESEAASHARADRLLAHRVPLGQVVIGDW